MTLPKVGLDGVVRLEESQDRHYHLRFFVESGPVPGALLLPLILHGQSVAQLSFLFQKLNRLTEDAGKILCAFATHYSEKVLFRARFGIEMSI